ncbi:DUF3592 domain-containing protein [Rhodoferax saidenbachensis]|nr:DUF3592 domain-containing protein [Rhodoferax saidenbachensis]
MVSTKCAEQMILRAILGLSVAIIAFSVYEFLSQVRFIDSAQTARGRVVAVHGATSSKLQPEIEFTTKQGEAVSFIRAFRGSAVDVPAVGSSVEVLYSADAPSGAVENSFLALWGSTCIAAALGLSGLLGSLVVLFLARRGGTYEF